MNYSVRIAQNTDQKLWGDFISQFERVHHAFRWEWREVLTATFGHKAYYLVCENQKNGSIEAILPLFLVHGLLSAPAFISVPYLNAGGILSLNEQATGTMLQYAIELCKKHKTSSLELRNTSPLFLSIISKFSLSTKQHKVAMHLELKKNAEELFSSFPPKLRSQIRRPTKEGCSAEVFSGNLVNSENLKAFYSVFAESMRDLGTPVYPRSLFRHTLRSFGNDAQLIIVRLRNTPVSVGIIIGTDDGYVEIPWAASLRKHSKCAPNMLLYWTVLKTACEKNYRIFDFGRSSPDSGTFKFKAQWGAKSQALHWHYHLESGEIPNVSPNNPKYHLLISAWKRLPVRLSTIIGPYLTRSLP